MKNKKEFDENTKIFFNLDKQKEQQNIFDKKLTKADSSVYNI